MLNRKHDVLVIGGGPAGLSAAIEIGKTGLSTLVLDKGSIVNSIRNFPTGMIFFSTSDLLEIGGVPFVSSSPHPTRTEAVNYYARVARSFNIEFGGNSRVVSILHKSGGEARFIVEIRNEVTAELRFVGADNVIVATGFYDNPNMLGVPGESLPMVSHYYGEPGRHFGEKVAVVGGKNSAVEAAIDLHRHGVTVTLIHRGAWFGKSVKYWILPDIENRVKNGEITAHFNTKVVEIRPGGIIANENGADTEIECDYVYALTGYHPDTSFLRNAGVEIDSTTGVPRHDPSSLETNVEGIYIAGSIVAGYDCNRIFIENGREHGKLIAKHLSDRMRGAA